MSQIPTLAHKKARLGGLRQKFFGSPACFKIPLAVCGDTMVNGTLNFFWLMGLNHISWLPFPCRSK